MPTTFVQSTIQGRLGEYDFEILDEDDQLTSVRQVQLKDPFVIEWGQQGRAYPDHVLKSRAQVEIIEGGFQLRDIFAGGFGRRRFRARISGPGVEWSGFVQPESRKLSLNPQVDPGHMPLLIADDFEGARNRVIDFNSVSVGFEQLARVAFAGAPGGTDVRFPGQFVERDGTTYDYTSIDLLESVGADVQADENKYEALISALQLFRGRVYRALSIESVVLHELRATGLGLEGWGEPEEARHPIPGDVYEPIDQDVLLDRPDSGFEDVEQAGTIKMNLGREYNLLHAGTVRITQVSGQSSDTSIANTGIYNDAPRIQLNTDDGVNGDSIALAELGEYDPDSEQPVGVKVEWTVLKDTGKTSSLTITLSDANGNLSTQSVNGLNKDSVAFGPTSDPIDPEVTFEGEGISSVEPQAYYVFEDQTGGFQRVETLFDRQSPTGVEQIEIEQGVMPYVDMGIAAQGIWAKRYENSVLSITAGQPFLAYRDVERAYRPFGIQSVKATIWGLYGPEDLLVLEVPDGETTTRRAAFVCGKGRAVNVTEGTTKISDVEIPNSILPTQVP